MISRAELLAVTRNAPLLRTLVSSSNDKLLLSVGVVPIAILRKHLTQLDPTLTQKCSDPKYETNWDWLLNDDKSPFVQLIDRQKLLRSADYVKPNPHDRTRLVDSRYDIARPMLRPGQTYKTQYNVKGRNRLLLWELAANPQRTGSKSEAQGLQLLLEFFRLPHILRAWRKHRSTPNFKLPEDAR